MQPVETPHDCELGLQHPARQVADAATTNVQSLSLFGNRSRAPSIVVLRSTAVPYWALLLQNHIQRCSSARLRMFSVPAAPRPLNVEIVLVAMIRLYHPIPSERANHPRGVAGLPAVTISVPRQRPRSSSRERAIQRLGITLHSKDLMNCVLVFFRKALPGVLSSCILPSPPSHASKILYG
jgi:hypothetical protein